jgi:hypothetical protein
MNKIPKPLQRGGAAPPPGRSPPSTPLAPSCVLPTAVVAGGIVGQRSGGVVVAADFPPCAELTGMTALVASSHGIGVARGRRPQDAAAAPFSPIGPHWARAEGMCGLLRVVACGHRLVSFRCTRAPCCGLLRVVACGQLNSPATNAHCKRNQQTNQETCI